MEDAQVPEPEPETYQEPEPSKPASAPAPSVPSLEAAERESLEAPAAWHTATTLVDADGPDRMLSSGTIAATLEDAYPMEIPSAEPLLSFVETDAGPLEVPSAEPQASTLEKDAGAEETAFEDAAPEEIHEAAYSPVESPSDEPQDLTGPVEIPSDKPQDLTGAVEIPSDNAQAPTAPSDKLQQDLTGPVEIPDKTLQPPTGQACGKQCQELRDLESRLCPPPSLTDHAIMQRLRRIFKRRANGEYCDGITQELADMFNDTNNGGRNKVKSMFEKAAYSPDRGPHVFECSIILLCF